MEFGAGVALILGVVPPASLNSTLPGVVVWVWGVMQLLGGALIIAGILLRYLRPAFLLLGLRLERAGLWPLAAACSVYGLVVLGYAGVRALYPAVMLLAFAVACGARARSVAGIERTIHRYGGSVGD
ncbi:hypothetical protein ACFFWE_10010 [Sphaerisporangium melleum]|uniref:hypothetical protein n=1 Tax=Sphaerisporangium melleum TaxID=321316 RepID=UPI00166C8603|nr:hypothetical protein [Sphaerisporangium melleum]